MVYCKFSGLSSKFSSGYRHINRNKWSMDGCKVCNC